MSTSNTPDPAQIRYLVNDRRYAEARAQCAEYTRLHPHDPNAWLQLASLHAQMNELHEVVHCCGTAIKLQPENEMAHYNLGVALQGLQRYQEAEVAYRQVACLNPGNATALSNLSAVLLELGRPKESLEFATQAVSLNPASFQAHNNMGLSLKNAGRFEEAVHSFQQALRLNPRMAPAHYNLGLAFYALGRTEDAVACFRQAISIKPDYAEAYGDLGVACQAQGKLPEALQNYNHALELRPDLADTHWNRSLARLLTGDFENGWPEYEWRWRRKEWSRQKYPGPGWNGALLHEKCVFISAEQGLGDTLQFVRYLPLVKKRSACVIFECQPELFRLLRHCDGIDQLVKRGDPLPAHDAHAHLLDLPGIFHTTLQTIPCVVPYINPPPEAGFDTRIFAPHDDDLNVGIVWAGNPGHTNDRNRSFAPSYFRALTDIPGVRLYSLQKGERARELKTHGLEQIIVDLGILLDDFAATAAALERLDLLITVDTSVAHLAGAMGRTVWLLLPFAPDWRWLLQREDSPWYPTMRLFRQDKPGNWLTVFERVRSALATLTASRPRAKD